MITDPNLQLRLARERMDLLRADYGASGLNPGRLRRRAGVALVSLGLRLAGWPSTASEALPHSSRA